MHGSTGLHVRTFIQEREIRQLQEASVTSDGMLSCYTPFLLAIVKQRVADPRQRSRISAHTSASPEKVAAGEGSNNPNTFSR